MNISILDRFLNITGYDIQRFLEDYRNFTENHYPSIVGYYNGEDIDQSSFEYFDHIKRESDVIEALIDQHYDTFNTTEYWDLVDYISDIQSSLMKIGSLSKWLRSSRSDRYSQNMKLDYVQKQNQDLEAISSNIGFTDQNDWVDLAVGNQMNEEDYTNRGGKMLKAILPQANVNFEIDNIVDSLSEDNIYGKDIYKSLTLSNNDLETLEGKDSMQQSFDTIMASISGSIPEFPEDGVPDYIYGTNQNVIQYPIIFRSLLSMFQKDKRFVSFEILNIRRSQDSVFIDTQTRSITGDVFAKDLRI